MNSTTNSVARDSDPLNFVPSNLQCRSQEPSASQTLYSENDLAARKNGMLSREQWENLKPIIRRLYIDENETIKSTSKYLGEHHNFEPTKRQLLRKISEWGFEKNVKRLERQVIIACEEDGLPVGETIRGRKFDKAKLRRWKNQEGGHSTKTQIGDFKVALRTKGGSNSVPGNSNSTNPSDITTTAPDPDSGATSQVRIQQAQSEPKPDNATDWIVSEADIWNSVDVPGSPKLVRLIGALTCFVDACSIPFLDIEASGGGVFEESANQSLADDDIMDFELEDTNSFHSNDSVILSSRLQISEPWMFGNYHECQASSNFREASLCPGLSPFPTADERQMSSGSSKLRFLTEKECITRLRTMRRTRIPDNELLENVFAIATDYQDNEHYAAAEIWYRRLVSAKQSILWFKPIETLGYCLDVVVSKVSQSKYKEARELHKDLHVKIMQRTWGRRDAIIKYHSMMLAAHLLQSFGNRKEEENVRRQVLQISLTTFGVKSDYTAVAMARLGRRLLHCNRTSECEFLLYSSVHLGNQSILDKTSDSESSNGYLGLSESMLLLAKTWNSRGKLQEARRLVEVAIQKHRGTRIHSKALEWDLSFELFYNMHSKEGVFVEAERILRDLLERLGGTVSPSRRTKAIYKLGKVLSANCHHAEAASCFKEAFLSEEGTRGLNHRYTMRKAKTLGLCFVNQGLYQEALAHHQEVLDRLHQMANEEPERTAECVQNVQRWMSKIKLEMLEAGVVAE